MRLWQCQLIKWVRGTVKSGKGDIGYVKIYVIS